MWSAVVVKIDRLTKTTILQTILTRSLGFTMKCDWLFLFQS
jgi:hypothetical protein